MTTTTAIRLTMDEALRARLDELADFHGESAEDTVRLLIRAF